MRPLLPIAAAVLLTAGAVAIPALTQAQDAQGQATSSTTTQHYKWKRTHIDVAAMSASMSAQNPNAFSPSTATTGDNTADQQPGAINASPKTPVTSDQQTDGTATSDSGVMGNSATTGTQNSPTAPLDDNNMSKPDTSTSTSTSPQ